MTSLPLSATDAYTSRTRRHFKYLYLYLFICNKTDRRKLFNSEALFADGWNNFTDVISSVLVLVGVTLIAKPSDENHPYGHWNLNDCQSATSFIMFFIGLKSSEVPSKHFLNPVTEAPSSFLPSLDSSQGLYDWRLFLQ